MSDKTISIFGSKILLEIINEIKLFSKFKIRYYEDLTLCINDAETKKFLVIFFISEKYKDFLNEDKKYNFPLLLVNKSKFDNNNSPNGLKEYLNMPFTIFDLEKKIASLFAKNEFRNLDDFKKIKGSFDYIFLSDVLLYFFVPYKENNISPSELLKALALKLNTGGKIYIMDPHGVFHLQPWFNSDAPYMLMTEYANRKFRVTPNLEELSIAIEKSGLKISKIRELKGKENGDKFYNEFPFWWFFELTK